MTAMKRREFVLSNAAFLLQARTIKDNLIIRSDSPADFETPVQLLDKGWITSNDAHYVRSHLSVPNVELNNWNLTVEGEVNRPLKLTMRDIRGFQEVTRTVTLECSGNGRAFADPPVAGLQWEKGAVGTARWTGIPLRDVLMKAQVQPNAKHVILNGADMPIRAVPDFVRSIPIEKAMHPDTILAYRMNGAALPVLHGFPLRLIVPGWEAAASTKWIVNIQISEAEASGFFMQTAYRIPNRPIAPGTLVDPKDTIPYTALSVKSIFTSPLDGAMVPMGSSIQLRGFAWAGEADITQVDVSTDAGSTWNIAVLDNDKARYTWRRFRYLWKPPAAKSFVVMSRATDSQGRTQPMVASWNPSGYLYNVADKIQINVKG
ncbi:MAG: sulfite oxidase-like oxidoreductase [Acidobacteria bacterium]|nr:MAG: sulfite oxidase-like oxidoreductase [Acidobacteriota bacterium]